MTKKNRIVLELEGKKITAERFKLAIKAFFGFIDELANQVTKKRKAIRWIVSVEPGSINLRASPELPKPNPSLLSTLFEIIDNGINIIENKDERPPYFSDEALTSIKELASVIDIKNRELDHIRIWTNGNKNILSFKTVENINSILKIHREELGSIEGKLQVISERRGFHFIVYDSLKDRPVRCYFDNKDIEKILTAFGKRVYVFGLIKYRKEQEPFSIQVKDFRIFPSQDELPTAKDVRGILRK